MISPSSRSFEYLAGAYAMHLPGSLKPIPGRVSVPLEPEKVPPVSCKKSRADAVFRDGMARRLRFVPPEGSLVEVTTRTLQGRFLLKPSPRLNSIVLGCLGRAQRSCGMVIHAFVFLSNHYHLLLTASSAHQLATFMGYFNGNLAKEIARLQGWKEKVWSRRYQAILVSNEPLAQVERLRYLLAHGAKEGLVASPREWPGATCLPALLESKPLTGLWFDRTREYSARIRQEPYNEEDFASEEEVVLEPLPCWAHVSEPVYRRRILELVESIEAETAARHVQAGTQPIGLGRLRSQRVHGCDLVLILVFRPFVDIDGLHGQGAADDDGVGIDGARQRRGAQRHQFPRSGQTARHGGPAREKGRERTREFKKAAPE